MARPTYRCEICNSHDCAGDCVSPETAALIMARYRAEDEARAEEAERYRRADNEFRSLGRKYEDSEHLLQWDEEANAWD